MARRQFTVVVQREADGWVATCPEVDVASQGDTVEQAKANLREAMELFFEHAGAAEVARRTGGETFLTSLELDVA